MIFFVVPILGIFIPVLGIFTIGNSFAAPSNLRYARKPKSLIA